jgi:RHS repeat-associated protein
MSCDPAANGFQTTGDYILGPSGEQGTEMAMDANSSMAWQHTNVWAAGRLLATYDPNGLHFYLNDPLGTRRAQTDYAGVLEQSCQSLPFGDALTCSGGNLQAPTEHHFTGKERDTESGNDYFGARYYASSMGRFMSPDWSAKVEPVPYSKLDDPQTLNLYAYVTNNPLTRRDLDGHCGGYNPATGQMYCPPDNLKHPVWAAAPTLPKAQQQSGSSGGGGLGSWLKHGFSNLFHGHSWGYVKATVTDTETYSLPAEPNGYVTAGTDIAGVAALGSEKAAKVLGPVGAAVSAVNDPSPYNLTITGLGFVPYVAEPVGFISAEADYLNWEFKTFVDGAVNAEAIKAGQRNSEMGIAPSPGERMGDCPLNMCN